MTACNPYPKTCMLPLPMLDEKTYGYIQRSLDTLRALDPDVPFKKAVYWNGPVFSHECDNGLKIRIAPRRDIPELGHAPAMCISAIEVNGFSDHELPRMRFFHSKPIPVCASDQITPENPDHPAPHIIARAYGEAYAFPAMQTIESLGLTGNTGHEIATSPYGEALTALLAYYVRQMAPAELIDMGWILNPFDISGPTASYIDDKPHARPRRLRFARSGEKKVELACVHETLLKTLPVFSLIMVKNIIGTHISPITLQSLPITDLPEVDAVDALAAAEKLTRLAKDILS